jgi:hypothetical protein
MNGNTPVVNGFVVDKPGKPKFTPAMGQASKKAGQQPAPMLRQESSQSDDKITLAYFLKDRQEGVPMENSPVPPKGKHSKTPSPKKQPESQALRRPAMSSVVAPQIRLVDGRVVLERNPMPQAKDLHAHMEVVNESDRHLTSATFAKRKIVSNRWSARETDLFYECLQRCGTDFSMVQTMLPHRSRAQVKGKFKLEERANPLRIAHALDHQLPFDPAFAEHIQRELAETERKNRK